MPSRRALVALALVIAAGCSGRGGDGAGVPVLGRYWGATRGYGTAAPNEIFNGGTRTGLVFDIEWESWGDETAIGHGTGYLAPPGIGANGAAEEPATVVASDLGDCNGVYAYRDIRWFFVEAGESISFDGEPWYDTCARSAELES